MTSEWRIRMCMEGTGRGLINHSKSASVYCTDLLILHMLPASVHRTDLLILHKLPASVYRTVV